MKIATCTIGRMENSYVQEFVDHYKSLGVDKMFIYDNNYGKEEHFEDVIMKDISDGFVEIVDFRDKSICQLTAYQDCYNRHNSEYDWFIYCDVDEFLTLKDFGSIKDFLSQDKFNDFDMIHVNWKIYDDNDQVVRTEGGGVKDRFRRVKEPLDFKKTYNFPENNHIKSIVRGGNKNVKWVATPHTPTGIDKCCDANGKQCDPISPFNPYNYDSAWFNHYTTKSLEEWLTIKAKRGYADGNKDRFKKIDAIQEFFKVNTMTKEKKEYIDKMQEENKLDEKLDIFILTHKDFNKVVTNPIYKVINVKNVDPKEYGLKYADDFYCELMGFFWAAKNYTIKDYIGFCHYRRYFDFMDNVPNVDEIFKEYDVILPKPIKLGGTLMEHYGICHNVEDLKIVSDIVKEWFPNYSDTVDRVFNGHFLFTNNMFIMRKDDFLEYLSLYKNVMDRYLTYIGGDIDKRIDENKDKYLKNFKNSPQNGEHWYQKRIGGFISERLFTVFVLKKFKKLKLYSIELTEKKYNIDKVDKKYETK